MPASETGPPNNCTIGLKRGWDSEDGALSATAYFNYQGDYYTTQIYPPLSVRPADWSNRIPSFYTVDLSLGYSTGPTPRIGYLKDLNFQLVFQNLLDRDPPFAYIPVSSIGTTAVDGANFNQLGRVAFFSITKKW